MAREFYKLVNTILISPDEDGIRALLDMAKKSKSQYETVVKAAIHHSYLGNPDKHRLLSILILGLEELEEKDPRFTRAESILQRLIGPLGGHELKQKNGIRVEKGQIGHHQSRALITAELMLKIAEKRPLKVARFLLSAMLEPTLWDTVRRLLDTILSKKPWRIRYDSLKEIRIWVVPALKNKETKEASMEILEKIIEEGLVPLIYVSGPVLGALWDQACAKECRELLEKILERPLRTSTPQVTMRLMRVVVCSFKNPEEARYGMRIAEKIIDEGEVPLIYLLGPLLGAANRHQMKEYALPLLIKIKDCLENGRELGKRDDEMNLDTKDIVLAAMSGYTCRDFALFFKDQMKKEGLWGLDYDGPTLKVPLGKIATIKKRKIRSK